SHCIWYSRPPSNFSVIPGFRFVIASDGPLKNDFILVMVTSPMSVSFHCSPKSRRLALRLVEGRYPDPPARQVRQRGDCRTAVQATCARHASPFPPANAQGLWPLARPEPLGNLACMVVRDHHSIAAPTRP